MVRISVAGGLEIKSVARRRDLHSSASLGAPFKGQNGVISGISLKVHESTSVLKSLKKRYYVSPQYFFKAWVSLLLHPIQNLLLRTIGLNSVCNFGESCVNCSRDW